MKSSFGLSCWQHILLAAEAAAEALSTLKNTKTQAK